jgi:signal transduction histidine kinase
MRERVAGLKGTFSLRSAPGQGTEIQVTLATAGIETSRQE